MQRLTKRNEQDSGYYYPECYEKCGLIGTSVKCDTCEVTERLLDKLGKYEDAEEQGLLVKVKCHCKDCKYWVDGNERCSENLKLCTVSGYLVGENGYCVYAERKNEAGK